MLASELLWSPEMLQKDHFYFKSWIFLVSSESFIYKRMSIALTSWARICRKTCFSSATEYSSNEKSDLLFKKEKKSFFLQPFCDRSLEDKHTLMGWQGSGYIWQLKKSGRLPREAWSQRWLLWCFPCFVYKTCSYTAQEAWCQENVNSDSQEFAALEAPHGPTRCVPETGISLDRHLTVWDSLHSLACFSLLLPCFRLTLEFPPDQIRFSQNKEVFVETPL